MVISNPRSNLDLLKSLGMIYLNDHPVVAIFNSRSTHTFISKKLVELLNLEIYDLGYVLDATTPSGRMFTSMLQMDMTSISYNNRVFDVEFILIWRISMLL